MHLPALFYQLRLPLTGVACQGNAITSLDLSANPNLVSLTCEENQLTSLNIQNGNNLSLSAFSASANPALTCIQVDNPTFMNNTWGAGKDAGATYSLTCPLSTPAAALNFDGVDDKIIVPNSGVNLANSSFSVEMWLKRNSASTYDIAFFTRRWRRQPNLAHRICPGNTFLFNFITMT